MRMARAGARVVVLFALLALVAACGHGPRPIAYGEDACAYCRMVVSDPRYGAEAVTATGKVQTFDSIECLAAYVVQARASGAAIESTWVSDFARPGTLVPAAQARYVRVSGPGSPLGKWLTAFGPDADTAAIRRASGDTPTLGWEDGLAVVGREGMERGLGAPVATPTMDSAHAR